jgi:hypothetical protein
MVIYDCSLWKLNSQFWRINIGDPGSLENKQFGSQCNNTILIKFLCGISITKRPYGSIHTRMGGAQAVRVVE